MSKHTARNNSRRPLMISWDNPVPAHSRRMIRQLKNHGRVRKSEPKTTVSLTPHGRTDWRRIRRTIVRNLHPSRGNAMYANLNSGRAFEYGRSTNYKWRSVA
jgi:ribosomal protein S19E (S16A)